MQTQEVGAVPPHILLWSVVEAIGCHFHSCSLCKKLGVFCCFFFAFVFQIHNILHLTSVSGKLSAAQWPWLSEKQFGEGNLSLVLVELSVASKPELNPSFQPPHPFKLGIPNTEDNLWGAGAFLSHLSFGHGAQRCCTSSVGAPGILCAVRGVRNPSGSASQPQSGAWIWRGRVRDGIRGGSGVGAALAASPS